MFWGHFPVLVGVVITGGLFLAIPAPFRNTLRHDRVFVRAITGFRDNNPVRSTSCRVLVLRKAGGGGVCTSAEVPVLEFVTISVRGRSAVHLLVGRAAFWRHRCGAGLACVLQARLHL